MFTNIIAFFLVFIPFFCWMGWGDGIRAPKETATVISLAVIGMVGFYRFQIKTINRYFLLFIVWCTATLFFSNYAIKVFLENGVMSLPSNLIAYKSLLYIVLAVLAIGAISSSNIDLKKISKIISIVCLVMSIYSILQFAGFDEWFRVADPNTGWVGNALWDKSDPNKWGHFSRRIVGTLGNPSILGIFLSFCLPFQLLCKNKLGYVSFALSLIIIALTISLTAYFITIVSLLFILFFKNKKVSILILAALILSFFALTKTPLYNKVKFMVNPTGRIEMYKESFNLLYKKAITGYGLGSFEYLVGKNPEVINKLKGEMWREAHNEYFQIWFETGIIGLILFLLGIFKTFRDFLKTTQNEMVYITSSFLGFLISAMTYFPMRISPLSLYGVVIFGLLTKGERNG